jgi:hypothetical protein
MKEKRLMARFNTAVVRWTSECLVLSLETSTAATRVIIAWKTTTTAKKSLRVWRKPALIDCLKDKNGMMVRVGDAVGLWASIGGMERR